jgi:hypothetical protein
MIVPSAFFGAGLTANISNFSKEDNLLNDISELDPNLFLIYHKDDFMKASSQGQMEKIKGGWQTP